MPSADLRKISARRTKPSAGLEQLSSEIPMIVARRTSSRNCQINLGNLWWWLRDRLSEEVPGQCVKSADASLECAFCMTGFEADWVGLQSRRKQFYQTFTETLANQTAKHWNPSGGRHHSADFV
jgi:hypothetical protein